jgi:site-specific DNA-methyltransferase (adenine-specific)
MNKTIHLSEEEIHKYLSRCVTLDDFEKAHLINDLILDRTINCEWENIISYIPNGFFDLIILDPPYNLNKTFNGFSFKQMTFVDYIEYVDKYLQKCYDKLKYNGTLYLCGTWKDAAAYQIALEDNGYYIQNVISWQRDRGRGAKKNYKNNWELIYFATKHKELYTFNVEAIKVKRKQIAPYKDVDGNQKECEIGVDGKKYRLTMPSNNINYCTIPFWNMDENTDHPTQKPETLIATLILASSNESDNVLDLFLGSGTTSVVAKKLGRHYLGVEQNDIYCAYAEYRLEQAETDKAIVGYSHEDGCFFERNFKDSRA